MKTNFKQNAIIKLDTALGIRHLHEQNIVHRDIAARNMLLTHTGKIKGTERKKKLNL